MNTTTTTKRRYTLTDLALDHKNMLAWLSQDGEPPFVTMTIKEGPPRTWRTAYVPVTDKDTLDAWWKNHRHELALEWQRSKHNKCKPQTHTQFIQECLRECGIKSGGTVKERVQRAIFMRPDRYTDAATIKRLEEIAETRRKEERKRRDAEHAASLEYAAKIRDEAERKDALAKMNEAVHEFAGVALEALAQLKSA